MTCLSTIYCCLSCVCVCVCGLNGDVQWLHLLWMCGANTASPWRSHMLMWLREKALLCENEGQEEESVWIRQGHTAPKNTMFWYGALWKYPLGAVSVRAYLMLRCRIRPNDKKQSQTGLNADSGFHGTTVTVASFPLASLFPSFPLGGSTPSQESNGNDAHGHTQTWSPTESCRPSSRRTIASMSSNLVLCRIEMTSLDFQ